MDTLAVNDERIPDYPSRSSLPNIVTQQTRFLKPRCPASSGTAREGVYYGTGL